MKVRPAEGDVAYKLNNIRSRGGFSLKILAVTRHPTYWRSYESDYD